MSPGQILQQVRAAVTRALASHPADVYLFGSWAHGRPTQASDIDIGILPRRPLPPRVLSTLREQLEESHVPYRVDVVDLAATDDLFRQAVIRQGIRWNDSSSA